MTADTVMDEWMDIAWDTIAAAFAYIAAVVDQSLAPLNDRIGPAMVIFLLVVVLVALTKLLATVYNTKRHVELKKDYEHWYALRQEAMACDDPEKGKALARNIDQARLNKAYYDYFFEGLLKSIITAILPILFTAAYINRAYGPETLVHLIGREHIFSISRSGEDPIAVSAFFWFVICMLLVHLAWMVVAAAIKRLLPKKQCTPSS